MCRPWSPSTQDTPFKMYSSLEEAAAADQRAIQSGSWTFDLVEGIMQANGHSMPWPGDVDPQAVPRYR
jgi:hypothetical protein